MLKKILFILTLIMLSSLVFAENYTLEAEDFIDVRLACSNTYWGKYNTGGCVQTISGWDGAGTKYIEVNAKRPYLNFDIEPGNYSVYVRYFDRTDYLNPRICIDDDCFDLTGNHLLYTEELVGTVELPFNSDQAFLYVDEVGPEDTSNFLAIDYIKLVPYELGPESTHTPELKVLGFASILVLVVAVFVLVQKK